MADRQAPSAATTESRDEEIDLDALPDPDGSTFWHPDFYEPFAGSANPALAAGPQSGVDSAYRGKEARQRANAPGRDTEGDASMPDKTTTRFRRVQAGQYATEDGRYLIEQQHYERECDCIACQSGSPDCPHDGTALDWFWHIWDTEANDYAEGTHFSSFETLREAKEWFV